jgi:2-polyprenyl-3-methyl-5-hydroxy-6-metoxy-1,4-benzoquinol methylase
MGSPAENPDDGTATAGSDYAERLERLSGQRWKQVLNVQAPYRWNVRRLNLGRTLDIGCGIGRNLEHLGGNGVGVDHNADSIAVARTHGFEAYPVDEFLQTDHARPGAFDSLLVAHVVEHMSESEAVAMLKSYLPYLKPRGRVCFITPQEAGYRTDATHVRFVDFTGLAELGRALGLNPTRHYSFPFPRAVGKVFPYNEFVALAVAG